MRSSNNSTRLQQFFGFVFPLLTLHELLSNVFPLLWICFAPQATIVKAVAETQLHAHTLIREKKSTLEATPRSLLKKAPIDFPLLNLNAFWPARCSQTNWHELCCLASQVEHFSGPTLASTIYYPRSRSLNALRDGCSCITLGRVREQPSTREGISVCQLLICLPNEKLSPIWTQKY